MTVLKEKQIEPGLASACKNSSLYSVIMIAIFMTGNLAIFAGIAAVPIIFHEPRFICKEKADANTFTTTCTRDYVCSGNFTHGKDYILDEKQFMKSFISDFEIYCSQDKIIWFNVVYFIGGIIGLLIIPYCIQLIGSLKTILVNYMLSIIFYAVLAMTKNYYVGLLSYSGLMLAQNILLVLLPYYIIEIVKPQSRARYICLNNMVHALSGLLCNFIEYLSANYRIIFIVDAIILLICTALIYFFLIDSVRSNFIRGNHMQILDDLEYVSRINHSRIEYLMWKKLIKEENCNASEESNIMINTSIQSTAPINAERVEKNKYKLINYINIWCLNSQRTIILFFTLGSFINQYNLLFVHLELKESTNYLRDSTMSFLIDITGYIFGAYFVECPIFQRWYAFFLINAFQGIFYIISGVITISNGFSPIFPLNRFFFSAFFTVLYIYNFEVFPTLVRPTASSINRVFARLFNLWTPLVMHKYRVTAYFFVGCISIFTCIFQYSASIPETKGKVLEEYPVEFKQKQNSKEVEEKNPFLLSEK